jgi:hypothetical protein
MSLAVGLVSTEDDTFSDIREITEIAAEMRRVNEKRDPIE